MVEPKCSRHVLIILPFLYVTRPPYEASLSGKIGSMKTGFGAPWDDFHLNRAIHVDPKAVGRVSNAGREAG